METVQKGNLELIFIVVSLGMILLAMSLIVFFILYQRKIQLKKQELKNAQFHHQKDLISAVIETKEIEKRHFALELHDEVGSTLTAIKFAISSSSISADEKASLNENLINVIQSVRRISNDLLPSILEEFGLIPAVRNLTESLSSQINQLTFKFVGINDNESVTHDKSINLAIYRVIQELLNNIIKYADATEIEVQVHQNDTGIEVLVKDNGNGFTPSDYKSEGRPSLGLKNIESRIQQIDGSITYEKHSKGTEVTIIWLR